MSIFAVVRCISYCISPVILFGKGKYRYITKKPRKPLSTSNTINIICIGFLPLKNDIKPSL